MNTATVEGQSMLKNWQLQNKNPVIEHVAAGQIYQVMTSLTKKRELQELIS